ncbi:MAG: F0F1 ATP synthase subunit gamma, partial [Acidiferrobacterales bacterium]
MAGAKEIRTKIGSIQNTQKITRAMEMVAASKMRKAQDRMQAARPYAEKMRKVIAHVAAAQPEYRHSYLLAREDVKRVGYIVVSSDRGLCGGLNNNLFRMLIREVDAHRSNNIDMDFCMIGNKAATFFRRFGVNIVAQATHLGDAPAIEDLIGTVKAMLDAYQEERIDRLYLAYNQFVNSMTQRPSVEQLLPREPSTAEEMKHYWDYIYEPEAKPVLDQLMNRYIESLVYQGVVENGACEQA